MAQELRHAGMSDYSIFLDRSTLTVFAVQKLAEENIAALLPETEEVKRWWAHMADLMECHPDNSPIIGPLTEVFHLE